MNYAFLKMFLGKSSTKVTTWLAITVALLGMFSEAIIPSITPLINELSPGHAIALGAALTWVGRVRGILKEISDDLQAP
ncbi:hypothetical protein UFOVP1082_35 [uncultured Caudovirales phage]|uniref:Uncharacterized protein n=1 Tax=uncultured Caudovirales phage TaxID=2100421 RepID=A0A6J5SG69_9CAUD|nr:hypothetical protein UFOVP906_13 [uncultured Caudovirales phage]CAB4176530.1 hypothetical protein UFOVP992_39 [uncultured Caudovirales phage]CAB4183383.1 hypothetical protein UFOVP1082_35 [uncultured Caudovirales phage]CAB4197401.1 hypothetical protein UFOVP1322_20 [uncultured Caudovirales phage]CAB4212788.1 hypothetical protein UFOVP1434_42 [uncultured Caudovirales phage]